MTSSHPLGYKLPLALRALGACALASVLCGGRCGRRRSCSAGPFCASHRVLEPKSSAQRRDDSSPPRPARMGGGKSASIKDKVTRAYRAGYVRRRAVVRKSDLRFVSALTQLEREKEGREREVLLRKVRGAFCAARNLAACLPRGSCSTCREGRRRLRA
eukprot:5811642-Pleurochrysis_carterae.AAC.2